MKFRRGILYYFRIEFSTLQGKITAGFIGVALLASLVVILSNIEYRIISGRRKALSEDIVPLKFYTQKILQDVKSSALAVNSFVITGDISFKDERSAIWLKDYHVNIDSVNKIASRISKAELIAHIERLNDKAIVIKGIEEDIESSDLENASMLIKQSLRPALNQLEGNVKEINKFIDESEQAAIKSINSRNYYLPYKLGFYYLICVSIGALIASYIIVNILMKIKMLKLKIKELGQGNLPETIPSTRDELNSIIIALNDLSTNLRGIKSFALEVGKGKFDSDISVFENKGELGSSLAEMRNSLKQVADEDILRNWSNQGIALFAELLRKHTDNLDNLCYQVVSELVKYLKFNQGGIFILNDKIEDEPVLELKAAYAYSKKRFVTKHFQIGQGLVGQAYLEKEIIVLKEIPNDYISITSGLGDARPKVLLVVPLMYNDKVVGVLELASFRVVKDNELDFIKKVSESIASTIDGVKINEETKNLLEEQMLYSEQLKAQEEEMRQNTEELQATQEEVRRQIDELNQQKDRFETLIENVPGILYRSRYNAEWTKEFVSENVESITGYSVNELMTGRINFGKMIVADDMPAVKEAVDNSLKNREPFTAHYRITTKSNKIKWIEEYGKVIYDEFGKPEFLDGAMFEVKDFNKIKEFENFSKKNLNKVN